MIAQQIDMTAGVTPYFGCRREATITTALGRRVEGGLLSYPVEDGLSCTFLFLEYGVNHPVKDYSRDGFQRYKKEIHRLMYEWWLGEGWL